MTVGYRIQLLDIQTPCCLLMIMSTLNKQHGYSIIIHVVLVLVLLLLVVVVVVVLLLCRMLCFNDYVNIEQTTRRACERLRSSCSRNY